MTRLVSLEIYKLRTTPAAWVALVVTVVLGLTSVASNILVTNPGGPAFGSTDHVNHALSISALTAMVMLAIGVLVIAGEYRHRTIMQTYLGEPHRGRVLVAKLLTVGGIGSAVGAVMFALAYLEAVLIYGARGVHVLPVDVPRLWLGTTLATALYGILGVALGALTRNTVAAILGGIAWALVIEDGILRAAVPEIEKWFPTGAAISLTSTGSVSETLLSPAVAAAVLVGWTAVLAIVAARFTLNREAH